MAPTTVEKVIGWALSRRTRRAEMLRRQLLSDVVTVLLFLLGLAAGLPVSMLLVLLISATLVAGLVVVTAADLPPP
ncbi:MAG TPA: hypothetical protein VFZ85_05540 [Jiangellaceae bacterium]